MIVGGELMYAIDPRRLSYHVRCITHLSTDIYKEQDSTSLILAKRSLHLTKMDYYSRFLATSISARVTPDLDEPPVLYAPAKSVHLELPAPRSTNRTAELQTVGTIINYLWSLSNIIF